jgi:polysaccharide biosynthesis transport protein
MERDHRTVPLGGAERAEEHLPSFLARVLHRRKRWIVLGSLVGLALAVTFHQLTGPWFEATAQLVVLKKKLDTTPISGPAAPGQPLDDYLPTHMLIISSPRVVREAVVQAKLQSLASLQKEDVLTKSVKSVVSLISEQRAKGTPEDRLTYSIANQLRITSDSPKPGFGVSHEVMNVAFGGKEGDDCAKVLDAVIASYHKFLKDTYRSGNVEALELIDKAREVLQKDLDTKEAAYRDFRRKTPLLWKGKDANGSTVHQDRLFQVDAQQTSLRMRKAEIQACLAAIESALKGGRGYVEILPLISGLPANREMINTTQLNSARTTGEPWNTGRPARETLEEQWFSLQLEEGRLLQRGFGPAHPDVQALRERIDGVRGMISPAAARRGPGDDERKWAEDLARLKVQLLKQELNDNERTDKSLTALFEHDQQEAKVSALHEIEDESRRADIERSKLLYESIIKRVQEIDTVKDYGGFNMHVLAPPKVEPYVKKYVLVLGVTLFLGLLSGLGGACLVERRDRSFRTPQDVSHALGLPVVGQVPYVRVDRVLLHKAGARLQAPEAEAYRAIRTALYFCSSAPQRVIQITSPLPGDGKTTLAANLGFCMAQSGKKVLLIDADLRQPRLHRIFGAAEGVGLTSLLAEKADMEEAIVATGVAGLSLLPSGPLPPNPAELLTSSRFKELLDSLRECFDFILIDTPPLLAVTDPCVVAPRADAVLLAIRNSRNSRPKAQTAREILSAMGARVLGVVMNGVGRRFSPDGYSALLSRTGMDRPLAVHHDGDSRPGLAN